MRGGIAFGPGRGGVFGRLSRAVLRAFGPALAAGRHRAEELGLEKLEKRLDEGVIKELILATSATVEGEATAAYLGQMAQRRGIRATRIAQGVPLGGELSYVDSGTLSSALAQRREVD